MPDRFRITVESLAREQLIDITTSVQAEVGSSRVSNGVIHCAEIAQLPA